MKRATFEIMRRDVATDRRSQAVMHARLEAIELFDEAGNPVKVRFDSRKQAEEALQNNPQLAGRKYVIVEVYD